MAVCDPVLMMDAKAVTGGPPRTPVRGVHFTMHRLLSSIYLTREWLNGSRNDFPEPPRSRTELMTGAVGADQRCRKSPRFGSYPLYRSRHFVKPRILECVEICLRGSQHRCQSSYDSLGC